MVGARQPGASGRRSHGARHGPRAAGDQVALWRWAIALTLRKARGVAPLIRYRAQAFRKGRRRRWAGAKTCNLGIWRDDFLLVDGLDESYVGYGREDSDLVIRLINAGVHRKEGRHAVPVVHLWHPFADRTHFDRNDALMKEVLESGAARARCGISRHMDDNPG